MSPSESSIGESLKKAFLIGVGASVVTAEKVGDFVRDVVDDLVDRGEITAIDARKLAYDLKQRAEKESKSLGGNVKSLEGIIKTNVETAMQKTVKSLGLATQDDLHRLRKELAKSSSDKAKKAEKAKSATKTAAAKKPARKPKK